MEKSSIREIISRKRKALSPDEIKTLSAAIQGTIISCEAFRKSNVIMAYMPIRNEVLTNQIINAAAIGGKKLCLPRVIDANSMEAAPVTDLKLDLALSPLNILEPVPMIGALNPHEIDLVIVPGLAFSRAGYRIGFGKGYYDRFIPLLKKECIKIAPAYHFQLVDSIPNREYDQRVDLIVTEKEQIRP